MRKYEDDLERTIRVRRLVEEWTRSRLLDAAQKERIAADLPVDVRRTNRFLRVTLGGFGLLIIAAAVLLLLVTIDPNLSSTTGSIFLAASIVCAAGAEFLIDRFRLYHFGVEEACAIGAAVLAAGGSGMLIPESYNTPGERQVFVAMLVGAVAAFAAYRRYGYVYAALGAMVCVGLAPFELGLGGVVERAIAVSLLAGCLVAARAKRRQHGDEFPGDEYAWMQAAAWLGIYGIVNLHLGFGWFTNSYPAWLVWITYAAIWMLPLAGLRLAMREKDRPLLDTSLLMWLATLVTNKPYLGLERKPWDPVLLGFLLIGASIAVRRWLAGGEGGLRGGFTATRLLRSEKEILSRATIVSTAFHPGITPGTVDSPPPDPFEGRGGRSGGGGGGASF